MPPLTGCAYYPEHWPVDQWAADAKQLREAGLSVVRLGEFAWDKMEPQPGQYSFDWLDHAVDILSQAGLKIVMCPPTATPPPWLLHQYPEIRRVGIDGVRVSTASRRVICGSTAPYRAAARSIVDTITRHYGHHPAVIGWQVDNEFGVGETTRCYCDSCRVRFQEWLAERYGSLDILNQAWGTQFWGTTFTDWTQIPVPGITTEPQNPSLRLDYRRFSSDNWVTFQQMQIDLLRTNAPQHWITHNFMIRHWSLDYWKLAQALDVVSYDNYPHGLNDPAEVSMNLDLMRSLKKRSFWVIEQQPGRVNWHPYNPSVPPGQVRGWTHQAYAAGASAVVYFRERAARIGQEQYHTGLFKWDGTPDQAYYEAQQVSRDLASLPDLARPSAQVGIIFDYNDLWSIELEPMTQEFSYWNWVRQIYTAFWQSNIPVDFLPREADLTGCDTVIVPAAILIHPGEVERWRAWVEQGGRLIVTFRSGVRELSNIATAETLPGGGLSDLIGAHVSQFASVPPATYTAWPDHRPGSQISAGAESVFNYHIWAETLTPTTANTLYHYSDGLNAGEVAVTQHRVGKGEVIYLGCWVEDFARFAAAQGWITAAPAPVQITTLQDAAGSSWQLSINHSLHPAGNLGGYGVSYEKLSDND